MSHILTSEESDMNSSFEKIEDDYTEAEQELVAASLENEEKVDAILTDSSKKDGSTKMISDKQTHPISVNEDKYRSDIVIIILLVFLGLTFNALFFIQEFYHDDFKARIQLASENAELKKNLTEAQTMLKELNSAFGIVISQFQKNHTEEVVLKAENDMLKKNLTEAQGLLEERDFYAHTISAQCKRNITELEIVLKNTCGYIDGEICLYVDADRKERYKEMKNVTLISCVAFLALLFCVYLIFICYIGSKERRI